VFQLLLTLVALIGCVVVFGAELFRMTGAGGVRKDVQWHFYALYTDGYGVRVDYADNALCRGEMLFSFCGACTRGGRTLLVFAVLAFAVLLPLLVLTGFRVVGKWAIGALVHPQRSLRVELGASVGAMLCLFIGTVAFWSSCISAAADHANTVSGSLRESGIVFVLLCFILLLVQVVLLVLIMRDRTCHLGWQASGLLGNPLGRAFVDGQEEEDYRQAEAIDRARAARRESNAARAENHQQHHTAEALAGGYQSPEQAFVDDSRAQL
jgi:hypothetical protein